MINRICDFVDQKTSELFMAILLLIGIYGMSQFDKIVLLFYQSIDWLRGAAL